MECILKHCSNKQRGGGYCKKHYHAYVFLKKRPLYNTWQNIKRRCYDPRFPRYPDWGGRGITMCEEWRNDYFRFVADIGPKPSPFHQLDRKNNNGNYEPGNVRWATATLQARNRRTKKTNTSGFTGVCWSIRQKQWQATITVNKHRIHLGWFNDLDSAKYARTIAEMRYF